MSESAAPEGRRAGVSGPQPGAAAGVGVASVLLLLLVVVVAAYWSSFGSGFHFDDRHAIEHNPFIRSLANVPRFFVDPDTTTVLHENKDLRPILLTTFALNHALSGDAMWSWHALNLVLHWLVAVLAFRIVRDHCWLGDAAVPVALGVALIVAAHPLGSEAVIYLSARSALLTTLFYLGAFDAALRGRRTLTMVLFVLALLTKAIAVTLPLALLGHRLIAPGRSREGRIPSWRDLAGLTALSVAALVYRAVLLPPWVYAASHQSGVTPGRYFMTEWSAYLYYLRLFVWPRALVVDRLDYPVVRSFRQFQAWGSLLGLVSLGAAAWAARRRLPALTFAAWWFFVTLAAESTFFPLAEPVNEHRPYLALLGLALAAALALWALARAAGRALGRAPRPVFAALMAVLTVVLGVRTAARGAVWRDDYTLWLDATVKAPANPRAWLNAGYAAMANGDLDHARRLLLEAHRLSPCYAYVQLNLSALAARQGQLVESLRWADEGVTCNPELALTHYYRGAALERLGRADEALTAYRRTTAIDPMHAEAWLAQARMLEKNAAWADAAAAYEHALAADPTSVDAAMHAALLYHYQLRDPRHAIELYRTVLRLMPTHYGAHYQLAVALLAAGRDPEAHIAWRAFASMADAIGDRRSIEGAPEALRRP